MFDPPLEKVVAPEINMLGQVDPRILGNVLGVPSPSIASNHLDCFVVCALGVSEVSQRATMAWQGTFDFVGVDGPSTTHNPDPD